jgi:predicted nuclease with TOPRIM domain
MKSGKESGVRQDSSKCKPFPPYNAVVETQEAMNMSLNEILSFMTNQAAMNAITLMAKDDEIKTLKDDNEYLSERLRQKEKHLGKMYAEYDSMQREIDRLRNLSARYEEYIPYKEKYDQLKREVDSKNTVDALGIDRSTAGASEIDANGNVGCPTDCGCDGN